MPKMFCCRCESLDFIKGQHGEGGPVVEGRLPPDMVRGGGGPEGRLPATVRGPQLAADPWGGGDGDLKPRSRSSYHEQTQQPHSLPAYPLHPPHPLHHQGPPPHPLHHQGPLPHHPPSMPLPPPPTQQQPPGRKKSSYLSRLVSLPFLKGNIKYSLLKGLNLQKKIQLTGCNIRSNFRQVNIKIHACIRNIFLYCKGLISENLY